MPEKEDEIKQVVITTRGHHGRPAKVNVITRHGWPTEGQGWNYISEEEKARIDGQENQTPTGKENPKSNL